MSAIIASVGFHSREWWPRLSLPALALALAAVAIPAGAQPPAGFVDLASEFAAAIAGAVGPGAAVRIVFAPDPGRMSADVVRALSAQRVRVVESADALPVNASCSANLRDRVCAAEIGRGDSRRVVITTRPRGTGDPVEPVAAIEMRPIYTQRRPMLDVAAAGNQLLVLTADSVLVVADVTDANLGGRVVASKPIATARVWPRDVRGRLHIAAQHFEAFLPGVTCRGTVNPFALVCADEIEPWPIGFDNSGMAPSRNTFAAPDGFSFYEAAPLGSGRFVLVSERSVLTLVDGGRRTAAPSETADHAAGFPDGCASGVPYVVVDGRAPDASAGTLRLLRVVDSRLEPAPSTATLPGALMSLWSTTGGGAATAIVHDRDAGRYEAFHVTLSCAR